MRRTTIGLAVVLAVFSGMSAGCKRRAAGKNDDWASAKPGGRLLSTVAMSDPHAAWQLISGFHSVEAGAWRWTEQFFAINLAPPHNASAGANLIVKLTIPPVTIEKLKSITLAPSINGKPLDPETFTASGDFVYRAPVPGSLLNKNPVRVDFALDKTIPPSGADMRELGVVVLAIGLEPQ